SSLKAVAVLQKNGEHGEFEVDTRVCVSTIHAAKGLEFRALHLLGVDGLGSWPLSRNLMFTAITRTKTSLRIYYTKDLPAILEAALAKLKPMPSLPALSAVFGKGK